MGEIYRWGKFFISVRSHASSLPITSFLPFQTNVLCGRFLRKTTHYPPFTSTQTCTIENIPHNKQIENCNFTTILYLVNLDSNALNVMSNFISKHSRCVLSYFVPSSVSLFMRPLIIIDFYFRFKPIVLLGSLFIGTRPPLIQPCNFMRDFHGSFFSFRNLPFPI